MLRYYFDIRVNTEMWFGVFIALIRMAANTYL